MDAGRLQDRISQGLGTAARAIGVVCDAYRSNGAGNPLAPGNRYLQLNAAFNPQDPKFRMAGLASDAVWYGVFDSAYAQAGDYLVERTSGRTWFVAALQNLLPPLCILANRVVAITRPGGGRMPGINSYGGGGDPALVVTGYPVSLLHAGAAHGPEALPADTRPPGMVALLPVIAGVVFMRGDLLCDDLGRRFVVSGAEPNALGWRLDVRQAAT